MNSRRPVLTADRALMVAVGSLVAALAVGTAVAMHAGWFPTLDDALIEMRVRDVPARFPLLGVYSRFGWNHPGPAQFVLLAVPYRLTGSASVSLLVTMLALHAAAVGTAVWIARKIDRLAAAAVLVALEFALLAAGGTATRSPWNPYVGLVLTGTVIVCAWGLAERERLASVLYLPLATVLVQAHAGNTSLVAGTGVLAVGCWWLRPGRPPWRPVVSGAAIAAVMWIPPVVAQVTGTPGRLSELVSIGAGDGPRAGIGDAAAIASRAFALVPSWAAPGSIADDLEGTRVSFVVPVLLVVVAAGLVAALRRRDTTMLRGLAVAAAAVLSATVGVSLLTGIVYDYLLVGLRSAAAVLVAVSVAALCRGLSTQRRDAVLYGAATIAVVLAVGVAAQQVLASNPGEGSRLATSELSAAVLASPLADEPLVLEPVPVLGVADAVMLQLERAGVDIVIDDPGFEQRVGAHRVADPDGAQRTHLIVVPVSSAADLESDGWTILDEVRLLDAEELAEAERLGDEIRAESDQATRRELEDRLVELIDDRIEAAVAYKR